VGFAVFAENLWVSGQNVMIVEKGVLSIGVEEMAL